jgi:hypothetical protein
MCIGVVGTFEVSATSSVGSFDDCKLNARSGGNAQRVFSNYVKRVI